MPIDTIEYKGQIVPAYQAKGEAMSFVQPYADRLLFGKGVEIGYNREDWRAFNENSRYSQESFLYDTSNHDISNFIRPYTFNDTVLRFILGIEPSIDSMEKEKAKMRAYVPYNFNSYEDTSQYYSIYPELSIPNMYGLMKRMFWLCNKALQNADYKLERYHNFRLKLLQS